MRLDTLNERQKILASNMLLRGHGEVVPITVTPTEAVLEEVTAPVLDAEGQPTVDGAGQAVTKPEMRQKYDDLGLPVRRLLDPITYRYVIGVMNPGQSGKLIAWIAAVAAKGINIKKAFADAGNMGFLYALDNESITVLLTIILEETGAFVQEHFDPEVMGMDVIFAFLRHNRFLSLVQKAAKHIPALVGANSDQLRGLLDGTTTISDLTTT